MTTVRLRSGLHQSSSPVTLSSPTAAKTTERLLRPSPRYIRQSRRRSLPVTFQERRARYSKAPQASALRELLSLKRNNQVTLIRQQEATDGDLRQRTQRRKNFRLQRPPLHRSWSRKYAERATSAAGRRLGCVEKRLIARGMFNNQQQQAADEIPRQQRHTAKFLLEEVTPSSMQPSWIEERHDL